MVRITQGEAQLQLTAEVAQPMVPVPGANFMTFSTVCGQKGTKACTQARGPWSPTQIPFCTENSNLHPMSSQMWGEYQKEEGWTKRAAFPGRAKPESLSIFTMHGL